MQLVNLFFKLLQSAGANAQNNNGLDKNDLVIHSASADDGPVFKRFRPRSQGRGFKIKNLHVILEFL